MTPDVSIIVPVYNRVSLIGEALASALAEDSVEVIVVDDASTDGTWEVISRLADPRVRAIRMEQNSGQSVARNRGLDAARGKYIKFLDSDDLLVPGHLGREVQAIGDADIAVSGWINVDEAGNEREWPAPHFDSIVDDVLAGQGVPTSAALYRRREDWRWDPTLRKLDDWDYFAQAALSAKRIVTVEGSAYRWRDHSGPRETNVTMVVNARAFVRILGKIEARISANGDLTEPRRRRLAQYFYKELRVLSLHDRAEFERVLAHIHELDPKFAPRDEESQWWMRAAARVLGTRRAVLAHTAIKRLVMRQGFQSKTP